MTWRNTEELDGHGWQCGYCGKSVGGNCGYREDERFDSDPSRIYICPRCENPTAFIPDGYGGDVQVPPGRYGSDVRALPQLVEGLYSEIRRCVQYNAHTAAVLAMRKLLMHVAVEKGAEPGEAFAGYVDYLDSEGYIPPDGREWVDFIRKTGNEANHEIVLMSGGDAAELLDFTEMLLKFAYEFPSRMRR